MTRILQISDTHIVAPGHRAYGIVETSVALARMVETIKEQAALIGPIDLIFVTGDLVDNGQAAEYAEFLRLTSGLNIPLVAIPGNHDEREEMRRAFRNTDWMAATGPLNLRFDLPDVTVLGLDSFVAGAPHGALSDDTLSWLQAQLASLGSKPILLGLHHPPFDTGIALMDRQRLRNAAELSTCLAAYPGACRIVAGHVHRAVTTKFAGHLAMICPGTSHAVTLDLRTAVNSSFMLETPGALMHDFGSSNVSHLVLSGTHDGPFSFAG